MSAWLLSILGISAVGVLVELLLTDSAMSKFVRSIYAFFILFVIVQPLPSFFAKLSKKDFGNLALNAPLIQEIDRQKTDATTKRIHEALAAAGIENCLVTAFGGKIYINAANSTKKDSAEIIAIVTAAANLSPDAVEVFI
jgi:hypothetical protein